ncbi:tyrosyl-DNA phosphodiesterase 1-like isoform X2 [Physella acuta]|uniref:tyrosyl-DNA phosphodiesterase 1-like isoform X2 n=1 Tax=Physella acuta TaxID=109671 RepID=UPI0027DE9934|nr:tyrosyl-DNA phosphodiesterase 1-like isoform X2 [Physella acuta]
MSTDEELARKLQDEFDREAAEYLSMAHNKHTLSDSDESDSVTDDSFKLNSSRDLFQSSSDTFSSNILDTSHSPQKSLHSTNPYDADTDLEEDDSEKEKTSKPVCKYGVRCYRKNPSHYEEFYHPKSLGTRKLEDKEKETTMPEKTSKQNKSPLDVYQEFQPFSFFLTKVKDIPVKYNSTGAFNLRDILSESMGQLAASCHFNFMFDIPWLIHQYPEPFRKKPVLLVHGDQGRDEINLKEAASPYSNVALCRATLDIPYGTHHTKMMLLLYNSGLRVVIHTANMVSNDWHQKTQGIWVSPLYPPLQPGTDRGESPTNFKADLLQYMAAYRSPKLAPWEQHIKAHDMSSTKVHLIGSVPGRHTLNNKHLWGHLKLKKVLSERGPEAGLVQNWPLIGQFSSIGSLGANKEAWLLNEWGQSISTCRKQESLSLPASKLNLIFPSKDNIRLSLEGYNGGGCVPYSIKTASKQPWLTQLFCQWVSEGRGRSKAVPHIKTYTRHSPDGSQAAWFLVSSANLSKAAWGVLEKDKSQLMIRSYELGVLFLPQYFGCKNSFPLSSLADDVSQSDKPIFPLPYDLPPKTYVKGDRPWFIDVPCMDIPDTFGTMWCPPL